MNLKHQTLMSKIAAFSRPIGSACLSMALLLAPFSFAEPRPEPYGGIADHYEEVRNAIQRKQWSEAISYLQKLERQMPSVTDEAEYHNLTGFALRNHDLSKIERAIEHYKLSLRIDPKHVQAREYLGQAYLLQGRQDLALSQLQLIEHHCNGRVCPEWSSLHQAVELYINKSQPTEGK